MADQAPASAAPEGQPAAGGSQGGNPAQEVGQKLVALKDVLGTIAQSMGQDPSMPKEAIQALQTAQQAYTQFLSIFGKVSGMNVSGGSDQGTMGQQPAEAMGNSGAVPADRPMGRNIKAVPA